MRSGTPTNVPGLFRDGEAWIVRATATTKSGLKRERRKRLEGTQGEAMLILENMRDELRNETQNEDAAPKAEILTAYARQWLVSLAIKRRGKIKPVSIETRTKALERFVLPFVGVKTP